MLGELLHLRLLTCRDHVCRGSRMDVQRLPRRIHGVVGGIHQMQPYEAVTLPLLHQLRDFREADLSRLDGVPDDEDVQLVGFGAIAFASIGLLAGYQSHAWSPICRATGRR